MSYCYDCGSACLVGGPVPTCPVHGPRWKLVRNACGAGVVITGAQGVLLGLRAQDPWRGQWEVPSGFVDLAEHPADAARREVKEELGATVTLTAFLGVYLDLLPDGEWVQTTMYVGEIDGELVPDRAEVLECRWFRRAAVPDEMAGDHRRRVNDWLAGRATALPVDR
ncbi:MAG: NUDIX hydrolase [Acidimicrobiales bacterium]